MVRAIAIALLLFVLQYMIVLAQPQEGRPAEPAPLQTASARPAPLTLQRACSKCGFVCDIRLKFCGMCGKRMPDLAPAPKVVATWTCAKYKHANPSTNRYCGQCGGTKPTVKTVPTTTSNLILKSCVNCSAKQRIDPRLNTYCVHCGSVLSRAALTRTISTRGSKTSLKPTTATRPPTSNKAIYCVSCGRRNAPGARACTSCGTRIPDR